MALYFFAGLRLNNYSKSGKRDIIKVFLLLPVYRRETVCREFNQKKRKYPNKLELQYKEDDLFVNLRRIVLEGRKVCQRQDWYLQAAV